MAKTTEAKMDLNPIFKYLIRFVSINMLVYTKPHVKIQQFIRSLQETIRVSQSP